MRINKLLSNYGYCSRREANRWIEEGRVVVNGQLSILGQWVELEDDILIDGISLEEQPRQYILYNKPVGITCTAEPNVKNNIIEAIGYPHYIFPVGRLDKDSQGLMFLTNDGDLAHEILESDHEHEKVYHVTVNKPLTEAFVQNLSNGVCVDGVMTRPCKVNPITPFQFEIILSQGLNRQIRKMCQAYYFKVIKLERVKILNLELNALPLGQWCHVTDETLLDLKTILNKNAKDRLKFF